MVILGFIVVVVGVLLLVVLAGFLGTALASTDVTNITGLAEILPLIAYVFAFAIVAVGVGIMVVAFKSAR